MRIVILFLLFLFSIASQPAVSQTLVNLDWNNNSLEDSYVSSFNEAVFLSQYEGLPAFQSITPSEKAYRFTIKLIDLSFVDVSEKELKILNKLNVGTEIDAKSEVLSSNGRLYNRVIIFPFVRIDNNYKKLNSFKYLNTEINSYTYKRSKSVKQNSVLSSLSWYKISVANDGVYKLDFEDFQSLGINTASLDVNSIRLYGNGGGMLPRMNSIDRDDDLIENNIQVFDVNGNGLFENDDYVLFYGESPDVWNYDVSDDRYHYQTHLYSDKNFYFLTIDNTSPSKRIYDVNNIQSTNNDITTFTDYLCHENDFVNLIQSGSEWYGEEFDSNLDYTFGFNFPNRVLSSDVYIRSSVASRAFSNSSFSFLYNSSPILNINLPAVSPGYTQDYASHATIEGEFSSSDDNLNIQVSFNRLSANHQGWLNYIELNVLRELSMVGSQFRFRNASIIDSYSNFKISNSNSALSIWNVTDPHNVYNISTVFNNQIIEFIERSDVRNEFIAFYNIDYLSPVLEGPVLNQNLHGDVDYDMIIVSHPDFFTAAQNLSNHHYQESGKLCKVVTPEQIYNEFSSGKQDVSAIRDYCKYLYELPDSRFKYLLLLGDASYDPKDRIQNNTNFVITYQSENSLSPLNTFVTDDYFGMLDDSEGLFLNDLIDIGIGRIPSTTLMEANEIVNKIIHYSKQASLGEWTNRICFIADDGDESDGNIHMNQSESLADIIDENYNAYNLKKIYLDSYDQESTPIGPRSPDAHNEITNSVEKGCLLINYTGHGGEGGLTVERIVDVNQILDWKNYNKLSLFVTATCEFGRFDNPARISAGEHIILNPSGGGVALLTTTRYVYSHLNYSLNTNFMNTLFEKVDGEYKTLGEAFLDTKVMSGTSINSNKFTLLGDPMMKLSYPDYDVISTFVTDTLGALQKVYFEGEIVSLDSNRVDNFNGKVNITVFDKERVRLTQGQESCVPMPYNEQESILYKGTSTVFEGMFDFSFVVPKDIDYDFDHGRISYYASSNNGEDASGWDESFLVGGFASSFDADNVGPKIELYLNNDQFVSGGITDNSPVLLAFLEDSSGINTVGNGIGHDITLILDGDVANKIILNDYYESDQDSYQKGRVEYKLNNIDPGLHTLEFKAWDVFNNSAESSLEFVVSETEEFVIDHLLNFPNPFSTYTGFYFEHNRINQFLDIQIQIFTVAGNLVKTLSYIEYSDGFRIGPISWNGKDDFQDHLGRGTYVYRLRVKDEQGDIVEKFEKLVILR